jgi:hypothetical protein
MKMQEYTAQAIADFIQNAKHTKAGPKGQHDVVRMARASAQEGGGQHVWSSSKKAKRSAAEAMERECKKTKLDEERTMQAEKAKHAEQAVMKAEKAVMKAEKAAAKQAEKAAMQAEKAAKQAEKAAEKQAEKDQKAKTSTQDAQEDAAAGRMIMQAKEIMMAKEEQVMERFEQKTKAKISRMAMPAETATAKQAETAATPAETATAKQAETAATPAETATEQAEKAAEHLEKQKWENMQNLIGDIRNGLDKMLKDRFADVPEDKKDEWKDGQVSHGSIPSYIHIIYVYMLCICI